jgi:hypothetical protein
MFIPGQLISAVTFIGVIIHEFAHQLFCRLMKVPVFKVKYFQFGNPSGYVLHEKTDRPLANFMITVGPFIVNTVLGIIILLPAAVEVIEFKNYTNPVALVLAWLGVSVLMHSFPSTGDAKSLTEAVIKNKSVNLFVRILVSPVVGLIYLGSIGSMFWLDFMYALAVGMVLPRLIALAV